jgi:predicted TIM-barrel fold metal-dependent hydrolase
MDLKDTKGQRIHVDDVRFEPVWDMCATLHIPVLIHTGEPWSFFQPQDRVLFGKDVWAPDEYHCYFRVLETADEYFDYYRKRHAFWKMYGLDLPDDVLKKLYYKNALRIIPGLNAAGFPQ